MFIRPFVLNGESPSVSNFDDKEKKEPSQPNTDRIQENSQQSESLNSKSKFKYRSGSAIMLAKNNCINCEIPATHLRQQLPMNKKGRHDLIKLYQSKPAIVL